MMSNKSVKNKELLARCTNSFKPFLEAENSGACGFMLVLVCDDGGVCISSGSDDERIGEALEEVDADVVSVFQAVFKRRFGV